MMVDEDRVVGALLGAATGDALGAGYETLHPPFPEVEMIGGGLGDVAPGEWTDDTAMTVAVAQVLARDGPPDLVAIGQRFLDWAADDPPDIGISTRAVLQSAASAEDLPGSAARYLADHPNGAAGNGALMRTAPVALRYLGDDDAMADAARAVAALTHADPLAGDSCVLWCIAIDRAVREGRFDGIHEGLRLVPDDRRGRWRSTLDEVADGDPSRFVRNGFTVTALQAAYSAVLHTPVPADQPGTHLVDALRAAIRIGGDTDTVAAIAGALLGARWGASAIPDAWRRGLHGWPGLDADGLCQLAVMIVGRDR